MIDKAALCAVVRFVLIKLSIIKSVAAEKVNKILN